MTETVLVTGASSGIGRGLALEFARAGSRMVLVARRSDRLRALAAEMGEGAVSLRADLSEPGAARSLVDSLRARGLEVDVLVNNAGVGMRGEFAALDREKQMRMLHLNVTALTDLTRLLLPGMIERGTGGVLNVASTAAFQPGPNMAVYYATKAYVLSLSEALSEETRGTGVTVSCLCPGATRTEFADVADMHETRLFRWFAKPADHVVRAGYDGYRRGKPIVIPGWTNRLGVWSLRVSPRAAVRKLVRHLQ